jgi:hypothetical protein
MSAPSVIARDALRRWLRAHPNRAQLTDDPGRMTRAQLREACTVLGGDPNAVIHAYAQGLGVDAPTTTEETETRTMPLDSTANAAPVDTDSMLETIKDKLVEGGFGAVRQELREIIAKSQRPAEIRVVEKIVHLPAPETLARGVHDLRPARTATWSELFAITDTVHADKPITVWDHPNTPKPSPDYVFPPAETALALSQLARSEAARRRGAPAKHVLLIGPAGTGKSQWPREFAARTGRPFVAIPMSDGIEIDQLMGQTLPDGKGGARWQDGLLLAAIRQPGMVVCLDEVGGMRAAVGVALNGLLQEMVYYVPDTGERVAVARGVAFVATNNASLMDSGQARGYVGIGRQNRAFADGSGQPSRSVTRPSGRDRPADQIHGLFGNAGQAARGRGQLVPCQGRRGSGRANPWHRPAPPARMGGMSVRWHRPRVSVPRLHPERERRKATTRRCARSRSSRSIRPRSAPHCAARLRGN